MHVRLSICFYTTYIKNKLNIKQEIFIYGILKVAAVSKTPKSQIATNLTFVVGIVFLLNFFFRYLCSKRITSKRSK